MFAVAAHAVCKADGYTYAGALTVFLYFIGLAVFVWVIGKVLN